MVLKWTSGALRRGRKWYIAKAAVATATQTVKTTRRIEASQAEGCIADPLPDFVRPPPREDFSGLLSRLSCFEFLGTPALVKELAPAAITPAAASRVLCKRSEGSILRHSIIVSS